MSKNGDPSMNPFNKFDITLIDLYTNNRAVRLYKPDAKNIVNGTHADHGKAGVPYEIVARSVNGVLEITTITDDFYAKALLFLSTRFGGAGDDNGGNVEWSFPADDDEPDYEAMVEAHLESQAEIARGK